MMPVRLPRFDTCPVLACFVLLSWLQKPHTVGLYRHKASMLSTGQVEVYHKGQRVELHCEFYMERFNLFDNPVLWKKVQRGEETPINILGNILEPFVDSGRFDVTFLQTPPRYRLTLNIVELSLEDYGNYTCEVRAPQTTVIASSTHFIFVTAPVTSITIAQSNRSVTDTDILRELTYTENEPSSLHCTSIGGCPPPEMHLYLGQRDITSQFSMRHSAELTGIPGLRLIKHRTDRWAERFVATASDDERRLQCIVTVPGLGSTISTVKMRVRYAPVLKCDITRAFMGDKNVFIRCEIKSRPGVNALYWIIDGNGTTVSQGEVVNEYWTLVMDRSDGVLETRLFLREAKRDSFHTYRIVAQNNIGTTTHQVDLLQKFHLSSHQQSVRQSNHGDATTTRKRNNEYLFVHDGCGTIHLFFNIWPNIWIYLCIGTSLLHFSLL